MFGPADMTTPPPSDAALLARIRSICVGWPEVEEAQLQDRPLFRVRRRRFAIFNGAAAPTRPRWSSFGASLHFLTEQSDRAGLLQDPRFERSPHHGDRGWIALRLDTAPIDWAELAELLEAGYRQAAGRALAARLDPGHLDHGRRGHGGRGHGGPREIAPG